MQMMDNMNANKGMKGMKSSMFYHKGAMCLGLVALGCDPLGSLCGLNN